MRDSIGIVAILRPLVVNDVIFHHTQQAIDSLSDVPIIFSIVTPGFPRHVSTVRSPTLKSYDSVLCKSKPVVVQQTL